MKRWIHSTTRTWIGIVACCSTFAYFLAIPIAQAQDDRADRDRQYQLMDEEKQLLKRDDDLSLAIFETKRTINEYDKRLSDLERARATVKHALIAVQLKLIR